MIRKKECFPYFELLRIYPNHKILSSLFLWVSQLPQYFIEEDAGTSKRVSPQEGKQCLNPATALCWDCISVF